MNELHAIEKKIDFFKIDAIDKKLPSIGNEQDGVESGHLQEGGGVNS